MFAWNLYEMPKVDPNFITHRLNVDPLVTPKKMETKEINKTTRGTVKEEVKKLKQERSVKEVFFPEWLSNTVVVKKKIGKWRVCVNLTDLNGACLKDSFPVPKIDQLVNAIVKHQRMSFLDVFQGYHQIALTPKDREKTSFITPEGNYHYTVMPFGLKNIGATYQRMVIRMFKEQISEMVEVYIDDMVVKSRRNEEHVPNLVEIFKILRQHKLRLNADNCAFDVGSSKFLGYIITTQGIEVNPDQITAIQ